MSTDRSDGLVVRPATDADDPGVIALVGRSLGWHPDDPNEAFFRWKHRESAFGRSPAWVAERDGQLLGYRTFMRWQFVDDTGAVVDAVRAVDTATAPEARGLGIFKTLTLHGLEELMAEGVGLVFNTPNDQSRPGYLKMGWHEVGRLPVGMRPSGPVAAVKMARAKVPADLWSQRSDTGVSAAEALADEAVATALLTHAPTTGLRTRRSPAYLAWRFSLAPLHYRLLTVSTDPAEGGAVFRLRRRGPTVEAAVLEILAPDARARARLVRQVLRRSGADYAVLLQSGPSAGTIRLPGQGPLLTSRPLNAQPPELAGWSLTLGDIELF